MQENPYSKIVGIMKSQGATSNTPSIQVGQVMQPPPNLVVKIGDLQVDKENIMIADYLLNTYKRVITIDETVATGTTEPVEVGDHGEHEHVVGKIGIPEGVINFTGTINQGDNLAVLPTDDGQLYIVLARLVSL